VDQRERWQALQQHLKSARAAMEAGQRSEALQHAEAALVLDPAFLAAQTLRERIAAMSAAPVPVVAAAPAGAAVLAEAPPFVPLQHATVSAPEAASPRRPSLDLAQFEARARQRRVERRVAAAQHALAIGELADLRAAIDEITDLDPSHPDLPSLLQSLALTEQERAAVAEPERPLTPPVDVPDLPLVLPAMPDLTLVAAADTIQPVGIPASDVLIRPVAAGVPEIIAPPLVAAIGTEVDVRATETPREPIRAARSERVGVRAESALNLSELDAPRTPTEHAESAPAPGRRRSRGVRWVAAAAAFAGVVFAASRFQRSGPSDLGGESAPVEVAVVAPAVVPTTGADAPPADATPLPNAARAGDVAPQARVLPDALATAGSPAAKATPTAPEAPRSAAAFDTVPAPELPVRSAPVAPRPLPEGPSSTPVETVPAASPSVVSPAAPAPRSDPSPALGIPAEMPREFAAAPIPAPPPPSPAVPPAAPAAAATVVPRPDDVQLVKDVLQRYRSAYQDLNAERAHAIWPEVNEQALQRAFQALESQKLTFDACDVQLRGSSATATCRGTTQYVPKFGSREPRVEPRIWNFTLQKSGEAWQIASARTQR
jgi:hypothetical protein